MAKSKSSKTKSRNQTAMQFLRGVHSEPKTLPSKIEPEKMPILYITQDFRDQISCLCKKESKNEWSGALFYILEGESMNDVESIKCTPVLIYPMNIGTAGYTEYEIDEQILDVYIRYPELKGKIRVGHIHSHNTMATFFSSTDTQELINNVGAFALYVSVIVNNAGDITARGAFKVKTQVSKEITQELVDFFTGESIILSPKISNESSDVVNTLNFKLVEEERTRSSFFDFCREKMDELQIETEKAKRVIPKYAPYVNHNDGYGYGSDYCPPNYGITPNIAPPAVINPSVPIRSTPEDSNQVGIITFPFGKKSFLTRVATDILRIAISQVFQNPAFKSSPYSTLLYILTPAVALKLAVDQDMEVFEKQKVILEDEFVASFNLEEYFEGYIDAVETNEVEIFKAALILNTQYVKYRLIKDIFMDDVLLQEILDTMDDIMEELIKTYVTTSVRGLIASEYIESLRWVFTSEDDVLFYNLKTL